MSKVYLIRHGEVAWNSENAYVGATDLPLNEHGREQAERLADALKSKEISAVYSSDLSRARETAEIVAGRLGLEVHTDSALREVNYGEWEGLSENEIAARYPDVYAEWRENPMDIQIPGGESFGELVTRALPAFQRIVETHNDHQIAIVAHKSVNRVILCCLLGIDVNLYRRIYQGNSCYNAIRVTQDGGFVVDSINEQCHLLGE